jgi:phage shock protein B
MDDNLTNLLGLIVILGGLVCLRYLKLRMKTGGQLNAEETAAMERMAQTAQRLEQRVATLEQILDTEVPNWRGNPANIYRQAG